MIIVVLYVPEIPPKVNGFVTLSGGGGVSRKDHLVTLLRCHYWLGGVGVQGKSDNVTLYHVFFWTASLTHFQCKDVQTHSERPVHTTLSGGVVSLIFTFSLRL